MLPPDPFVHLTVPPGLDIKAITAEIVRRTIEAAPGTAAIAGRAGIERLGDRWNDERDRKAAARQRSASADPGCPACAKPCIWSRPGWNAIGAGEPALPGIALGHNESIAFGFTIVGIDQQDLYVEKINPANPNQYLYKGAWKAVEIEKQQIAVKGAAPVNVDLRYTQHGPILYEDRGRHLAYALHSMGARAGRRCLSGGTFGRARENWKEFRGARWRATNRRRKIWSTPIRRETSDGSRPAPPRFARTGPACCRFRATPASMNGADFFRSPRCRSRSIPRGILSRPPTTTFCLPDILQADCLRLGACRFARSALEQMLTEQKKFAVADFERMQYDVRSLPARRLQAIVRKSPAGAHMRHRRRILEWDARLTADSRPGAGVLSWMSTLIRRRFIRRIGPARTNLEVVLKMLEESRIRARIADSLDRAVAAIEKKLPHQRRLEMERGCTPAAGGIR